MADELPKPAPAAEPSTPAASAAPKEEYRFQHISPEHAQQLTPEARGEFMRREQFVREWEENIASARRAADDALAQGVLTREEYDRRQGLIAFSENGQGNNTSLAANRAALEREERDLSDMITRTNAVADRNNMPRPQVQWTSDRNAEGGIVQPGEGAESQQHAASGGQFVSYGAALVRDLPPGGARDFLAAHELAHTLPQNQELLRTDRHQAERHADEFAARQPGMRLEDARRALTSPASADNNITSDTHPSVTDRLINIESVMRERDRAREVPERGPEPIAAAPRGIPEELLASLNSIAQNLSGHGQQGVQAHAVPTMAASVPAPLVSPEGSYLS